MLNFSYQVRDDFLV